MKTVREIHRQVMAAFGGLEGVRDAGLLESAVAAPQASFGGESPFVDAIEVAGAYLFYVCRSHPFVDGNKRTAMTAAIVFLQLNGFEPAKDSDSWEALVLGVAASKLDREHTTQKLRKLVRR